MIARALGAACMSFALIGPLWANAPDRSLRPEARPGAGAAAVQSSVPVRFNATIRPRPRTSWSASNLRSLLDNAETEATTRSTPTSATATEDGLPSAGSINTTPLPASVTAAVAGAPPVRFNAEVRPRARPWIERTRPTGTAQGTPARTPVQVAEAATDPAPTTTDRTLASSPPIFTSPRPPARPANLRRNSVVAAAAPRQTLPQSSAAGSICGNPAIQGQRLSPIIGALNGCGVAEPVRVTSVHGIQLSTAATMDCGTAQALADWTRSGAIPAVGNTGNGIARYRVVAHYACRTRNSQPGARISEHGKGRAIDIAGFDLRNGETITLLEGWGQRRNGRILRDMWGAACGPFGTVLGPDSNRFHRDHFHFDTARYRSGSYCR